MNALISTPILQHNDGLIAILKRLLDRNRTREGTALASAARTATASSVTLLNHDCRGVMLFLNVTAASGTGGLTLRVVGINPITGVGYLNSAPAATVVTGFAIFALSPGLSTALNSALYQSACVLVPRQWRVDVVAGDASSYTYSVGYCLIP